ncbi:uncharacterized protein LOC126264911 [Aethina tumida]|uniref:uncharacterized protein LOC126264911 n=1 Tax=Aethina tumida TaxID=116153 RepID=UPI0021489DA0|nr:uncharacterized protein LOC126264911 [Aethina tumida]
MSKQQKVRSKVQANVILNSKKEGNVSIFEILFSCQWFIGLTFDILLLFYCLDRSLTAFKHCTNAINNVSLNFSNQHQKMLFYLENYLNPPVFLLYNAFYVNWSLVTTMASTMLSYLIILTQFKMGEK